jgi:diaminohydroxyphosphoribosylaminopyrimidine deaminase / 5-amino-6-(5-phosphoribosylamino)uracil reductase
VVTDAAFMRRALFHAARAVGATTPNPVVGAVVVDRDGVVIGQGRHERAGGPHAEVNALDEAGARAAGATMYVTLEPCCHVGRTGPCTDRILAAGITRVVAATLDPYPAVCGRGVEILRAAGVTVDVGLGAAAARRLNAGYLSATEQRRPFVVVKAAVSADGRIASAAGRRTAISGPDAARRTQRLRAAVDAIAVGSGTVLIDDPRLSVRDVVRARPWRRVIFDRRMRVPLDGALLSTPDDGQVIIVTSEDAPANHADRVRAATARGAVIVGADSLDRACRRLGELGIQTLLVEGGAALHRSFWEADLVDRVHLVVAPDVLGAGVPLFGGLDVPWGRLTGLQSGPCGRDVWIEADVHRHR